MKYSICCLLMFLIVAESADPAYSDDWYSCGFRNPCGGELDHYYFNFYHPRIFIQCGLTREQCYYTICPINTRWDQQNLTCTHDPNVPPPPPVPTWPYTPFIPGTFSCNETNPCTVENAKENKFFFAHKNEGSYVQCDESQNCFELNCNEGLIWDPASYTCDRPPKK